MIYTFDLFCDVLVILAMDAGLFISGLSLETCESVKAFGSIVCAMEKEQTGDA